MACFRQSVLVLFALVLGCGQIFAASSSKEQRDFAAAVNAFNDGLFPRAETEFQQFKANYPDSTNAAMALLMQARADFSQNKFNETVSLLSDTGSMAKAGNLADQYVYWIGEAQFKNGNYSSAADTFISLSQNYPQSQLRLRAVVEAANAFAKIGNWSKITQLLEQPDGVFQTSAPSDSSNELIARGKLLLAQAKFALHDLDGEFAILNSLTPQLLKPELDWQRAYLVWQNRDTAGDFDSALASTTNLLRVAKLQNDNNLIAQSVNIHAGALEKSGRGDEAIAAYSENLTSTVPAEQQRQAVLKIAALSINLKEIPAAISALEKFLAQFPDSPALDVVTLTLGELHLKSYAAQSSTETNDLFAAQMRFNQFIGTFTNSPLLGKAYLDLGWCYWTNDIPQSLNNFKMATDILPMSTDLAVAKFKLGDSLFTQDDFAGARSNYESVVNDFGSFPEVGQQLGAQALYQLLRSCLELNDMGGASNAMARIFEIHPTNNLTENSMLLVGQAMTDLQQPEKALTVFKLFKQKSPDSPLLPEVDLAIARAYEQEQDWPSAISTYENWVQKFSSDAKLLPQVEYARALAYYQAGNETNAYLLFTNFVTQFSDNALAPVAQWWIGDHFFRAGDFPNAEKNYKFIFQNPNWQNSQLVNPAKMMAGRAAVGWGGYSDAIGYFTQLTSDTNCRPELIAQALFAYGDALKLMQSSDTNKPLANFETAIGVFKTICQKYPDSEQAALALGEMGGCYLQLSDYKSATNAYTQVCNSQNADISARSQAQVGRGIVFEKMATSATGAEQTNLYNLALNDYLDVLYDNNLRDGEQADLVWKKKAGLQAASLAEGLGNYSTAINVYVRLEKNFPQMKESLEKKIAAAQTHLVQPKY